MAEPAWAHVLGLLCLTGFVLVGLAVVRPLELAGDPARPAAQHRRDS